MAESGTETCYLDSVVGWLRVTADAVGVVAIDFIDQPPKSFGPVSFPHLKEAYRQLREYFSGDRLEFNLPLNPRGTPFQRRVWDGLRRIPFGKTLTYGELAGHVGSGARAVGMANHRNPLPIVVPCHRVIGADGGLVGYASGVNIKERLLQLEGVF